MQAVQLKAGREKALLRGHPWIFSGSIDNIRGKSETALAGETVEVLDSKDRFLAWGAFSPASQIRVRIWSRDQNTEINREFFHSRLEKAIRFRKRLLDPGELNACRLVHAESDGIPGLIVDIYADTLVIQYLACGVEYWRDILVDLLVELTRCNNIYERSDAEVRKLENLQPRKGTLFGEDISNPIQIREAGQKFWVDIFEGQKTGFYLDQRDNRFLIQKIAKDRTVLDCFAYTGGFSVSALTGGARNVVAVESSSEAIALGRENIALNKIPENKINWVEGDVFQTLRKYRDQNQKFDLVILDPPKFAPTASHAQRAARGYKDINLLALKLLNPNGLLITFSCSGGISENLFQKILAGAAVDAGIEAKILARLGPGIDHLVALHFPEGAYLKGFMIQV